MQVFKVIVAFVLFIVPVGIWSVRHFEGPVLQGPNTRGCEVSGRTTHQLGISNQAEDKEELPAEVDCGIICKSLQSAGSHCESLSVEWYERVIVCCVLDTVTARCKWCMGQWHK